LDEVLNRYLTIDGVMRPTYIPENLHFMRVKIHVCPIRNPNEILAGRSATIYYLDSNFNRFSFGVHHKEVWEILGGWDLFFPQHWWDGTYDENSQDFEEIEINGHSGYINYWGGFSDYWSEYRWFSVLLVYIDEKVYFLYGHLEPDQMIKMIESLQ